MKHVCMLAFLFASLPVSAHDLLGIAEHDAGLKVIGESLIDNSSDLDPVLIRYSQVTGQDPSAQQASVLDQFGSTDGQKEGVFYKTARWPQGTTLKVCFFDGNPEQQKHVAEVVGGLLGHTNLSAQFLPKCEQSGMHVKVSFNTQGCWAYYGVQGLRVIARDPSKNTVSLCKVNAPWSAEETGVILHEFMHVLGAVHEHQSPASKCDAEFNFPWILSNVAIGTTSEEKQKWLDENMRVATLKIPSDSLAVTEYDQKSIVHYRFAANYFLDARSATCDLRRPNNSLSSGDIAMLNLMYPVKP